MTETTPWNVADYLDTPEDVSDFLRAIFEENDPILMTKALGAVARAKGMSSIAQKTGLSREGLYKALSEDGNPEFATIVKVVDALDLQIALRPKQTA